MQLALAILLGWLGAALLWVAFHGIDAPSAGPSGVIQTIAGNVAGST
jgi:hypothetical protein